MTATARATSTRSVTPRYGEPRSDAPRSRGAVGESTVIRPLHAWVGAALVTGALLTELALRNESRRLGYALAEARATRDRLLEERGALAARYAQVAAPDALARRAEHELGMRLQTPADVTVVPMPTRTEPQS